MQKSDYSILIVDDTDIILELLQLQLENESYKITTASSGKEALDILNTNGFDLILLDIEMPEMSGIDLLKLIRSNENTCNIPIFMLTAQNDTSSVKVCLDLGANDYLLKPFNAVTVKQRIWKFFQKNNKHRL